MFFSSNVVYIKFYKFNQKKAFQSSEVYKRDKELSECQLCLTPFGLVRQTHRVRAKAMPNNHHLKTILSPNQPTSNPLQKSKKPRICKLQHTHGNGDFPSFPRELRDTEGIRLPQNPASCVWDSLGFGLGFSSASPTPPKTYLQRL